MAQQAVQKTPKHASEAAPQPAQNPKTTPPKPKAEAKPPDAKVFAPKPPEEAPLVVVYSGMFSRGGAEGAQLAKELSKRGIPQARILVGDCPYPAWHDGCTLPEAEGLMGMMAHGKGVGWWSRLKSFFRHGGNSLDNVTGYIAMSRPKSLMAQDVCRRLTRQLPAPVQGKRLKIQFVGVSAGGQHAATTAANLKALRPDVDVEAIVTLGSPWLKNNAPASARLINYVSPGDSVLHGTSALPFVTVLPKGRDANDAVREFPNVAHLKWRTNKAVLDQLATDLKAAEPKKAD